MRRWFLSYHSANLAVAEKLEAALTRKDPEARVFFAPKSLRVGGYWQPTLADEIAEASAFVLLVGDQGLGPWQVVEYYEALDKRVKSPDFPVVLMLLEGQPAPGLPFLRQLHWIITPDPASEQAVARLIDAAAGGGSRPGDLWRYTSPYRGLAAMSEADSDFFFGRERETVEILNALAAEPERLPVLLGNSGVGKSSLAQAGVLAALKRQAWPEGAGPAGAWPTPFQDSRRCCFLTLKPGTEPLRALVESFLDTWQFGATDPERVKHQNGWIELLREGEATLRDLLDATERRYQELHQPKPPAFFLYVDQGEELYVRAEERQRHCFSKLIAQGLGDPRLLALMSLRADFLGALQNDEALYAVHRKIDVPPLREAELREVVSRPAALLSARFETDGLAADIARRTAEESARDAGALPLLSYLLDDMWEQMVARGDGVLRLPARAMELGGVLAERANAFLSRHPKAEDALRRVMTLKLATVREDGEPTRRRARRSEFTEGEWRLVSELADHPNRLLVTATPEGGETYAEVAHEAIFRRWEKLRDWMAAERDFLIWKSQLEIDRRRWEQAPGASKNDALLMGLGLSHAQGWSTTRPQDLAAADREFIDLSLQRETLDRRQRERLQKRVLYLTVAALSVVTVLGVLATFQWRQADRHRLIAEDSRAEADVQRSIAQKRAEEAHEQRNRALLSASRRLEDVAGQALARNEPVTAALLALEGLSGSGAGEDRPYLPALESILYQAGTALREIATLGTSEESKDHRRLAADDGNGKLAIYDIESGKRLVALEGHQDRINSIKFNYNDERLLATASADGTARLWDANDGRELAVLRADDGPLDSVSFENQGKSLVSAAQDGTVRIWSVPEGRPQAVLRGHNGKIKSTWLAEKIQRVITSSEDGTARLWDMQTGQELARATVGDGAANAGRERTTGYIYDHFNSDYQFVLITRTNRDKTEDAILWDAVTGAELARFADIPSAYFVDKGRLVGLRNYSKRKFQLWDPQANRMLIDEAAVEAELAGDYVVLWSKQSSTASIWDMAARRRVAELSTHNAPLVAVYATSQTKRVFTAAADGTICFWDLESGRLLRQLKNEQRQIKSVYSLLDGRRLLTLDASDRMQLWDALAGEELASASTKSGSIEFPSGRYTRFAVRVDGGVQSWDAETGVMFPKLEKLDGKDNEIHSLKLAPDGSRIVAAVGTERAVVWDVETGKKISEIKIPTGDLCSFLFSRTGRKLNIRACKGVSRLWDVDSGRPLGFISDAAERSDFSLDGNALIMRERDSGTVVRTRLWSADATSTMTSVRLDPRKIEHIAFWGDTSRSGVLAVQTSAEKPTFTAQVYGAETGALLQQLSGHQGELTGVRFTGDGRRIVTLSHDGTARIWEAESGKVLAIVNAGLGGAIGQDWLFVKTDDKKLQLWDTRSAVLRHELQGVTENVQGLAFSPDDRFFATWAYAGDARLWELSSGNQIRFFPAATGVLFSPEGDRAFVRFKDGSAQIVENATGRMIAGFAGWGSVRFSSDGGYLLVIDKDGARVVATASGQVRCQLAIDGWSIEDTRIAAGGGIVLTKTKDARFRLWNCASGVEIPVSQRGPVTDAELSPDGRYTALVLGPAASLLDINSGKEMLLSGHRDQITAARFSRDGRLLLTKSKDRDVRVWEVASGREIGLLKGGDEEPISAYFTRDARRIVTQTRNGLRLWNAQTGEQVAALGFQDHEAASIFFSADGDRFLVMRNRRFAPGANVVQQLDSNGQLVSSLTHQAAVRAIGVDGSRMLVLTGDKKVTLWDLTGSAKLAEFAGDAGSASLVLSPDRRRMAAAFNDSQRWHLRIWDGERHTELLARTFELKDISDIVARFTSDNGHLVVLVRRFGAPQKLYVFDAATAALVAEPEDFSRPRGDPTIVFAKGARRLLVYPYNTGDGEVWDAATGQKVGIIPGMSSGSNAVFSADEQWIAVALPDYKIQIWDAARSTLHKVLSGHTGSITSMRFSPDGRYLLSGSYDGTARVWLVATGEPVRTLVRRGSGGARADRDRPSVWQVEFSPDGSRIVTIVEDLIGLWDSSTGENIAAIPIAVSSDRVPLFSPGGSLLLHKPYYDMNALLFRLFPTTNDTVLAARNALTRCLTPVERIANFLDPEPPAWCIEMEKWPYRTQDWKSWLKYRQENLSPPLPDSPEWVSWSAARKAN
jgi:WD40 repeat protein